MLAKQWTIILVSTFFIQSFSLIACRSASWPLSKDEIKLCKTLSEKYKCEVSIEHDKKAIVEKSSEGELYVQFKDKGLDFCAKDSSSLKKIATEITTQIIPVLSYKSNYKLVDIVFLKTRATGKDSYTTVCQKQFDVNIKHPDQVNISFYQKDNPPE